MDEASSTSDVTRLLEDWSEGDPRSRDRLLPLVYEELKRIARAQMRNERQGHTLQTTAVVHEAYLKMVGLRAVNWQSRSHFLTAAAMMMRRLLIDHARLHRALKRGEGQKVPLEDEDPVLMTADEAEELLALDQALERLNELDARQGQIVELRHFGGLSVEETAKVVGVSTATVKRDWRLARIWLHRELRTPSSNQLSRA